MTGMHFSTLVFAIQLSHVLKDACLIENQTLKPPKLLKSICFFSNTIIGLSTIVNYTVFKKRHFYLLALYNNNVMRFAKTSQVP